eukprot:TRINITY_DN1367_c1_g1_i8.p1 TRINITY_DN1367_c1_g1~~TRINITY_DN1367_c1_g1_i8.p1  ORF type:complete len:621 (+),score=70.82 TRINITY_DN1367_c1_g1_i8:151-2013(+)
MSDNSTQELVEDQECNLDVQQLWYVIDNAWVLLSTFFILAIPVGYTLLEHGFSRPQSRQSNIGAKLMLNVACGLLSWWSIGYAFGYSDGGGTYVIGSRGFFQSNWTPLQKNQCEINSLFQQDRRYIDGQSLAVWWQQWAVAQIVGFMVTSAMAERLHSFGSIINSVIMTGFATPIAMRWVWSGIGFLSTFYNEDLVRELYQNKYGDVWDTAIAEGALDHAGSSVIHIVGGSAALVAVACVGRRTRIFEDEDSDASFSKGSRLSPKDLLDVTRSIMTESGTFGSAGGFLIWIGLLGVEASMVFGISGNGIWAASNAISNAGLSSAAAVVICILISLLSQWGKQQISVKVIANAALSGAVAAASGSVVMESYGAVATGTFAGGMYTLFAWCLRQLQVDDPLEIVAVNLIGGWCGMLATGFLATEDFMKDYFEGTTYGLFYGGGGKLLLVNVITASILTGWGCLISAVINVPLRLFRLLRLGEEEQRIGVIKQKSFESIAVKPYPQDQLDLPAQLPDHLPYQNSAAYQSVHAVVNRGPSYQQRRQSPLPQQNIQRSPSPRAGRPSTPPYSRPRTPDSQAGVHEITLNPHQPRSASAAAMLPPQRSLQRPSSTTPPIQDPPARH